MATKLEQKELPSGHSAADFKYMGRPAKDQGDFGSDVGVVDCACVDQFGKNASKYYHGGVVQSTKTSAWYCYYEWGRIFAGKSWNGHFAGQSFQFVACFDEAEARSEFSKQMNDKNMKRGLWTTVAGVRVFVAKPGKDCYIVQSLACREKGLPDAYAIKDSTGVAPKVVAPTPVPSKTVAKTVTARTFHPEVIRLAQSLVGGTKTYTRALSAASGVTPTMEAITQVRDSLIPAALQRIKIIGDNVQNQVKDSGLVAVSKMVMAIVPRPIPRTGITAEQAVLNSNTIPSLELDLDAFEAALRGEDFSATTATPTVDPDSMLNAKMTWMDPSSDLGKWVTQTYLSMTNHRHSNIGTVRVRNVFAVERPDRDARFLAAVKSLAAKRKGQPLGSTKPGLQPKTRPDLSDVGDLAAQANVFLGIHGTRGVNVSGILSSHFRLPKSLSGVHITGAAFGGGLYFATDFGKSAQYVGSASAMYGSGGNISGRGFFMMLCDVACGKFHYPRSAWGIGDRCPDGGDSVFAHPSHCPSLQNEELVLFQPEAARIRYLVEIDL